MLENRVFLLDDSIWKFFKHIYQSPLGDLFDVENPTGKVQKEVFIKPEIDEFKRDGKLSVRLERIFSFSKKGHSPYEFYRKYIEELQSDLEKEIYLKKLELYYKNQASIENQCLILHQGNLQKVKVNACNNRLDTFLWLIDEYYKGRNELLLNNASPKQSIILKKFLAYIRDEEYPSRSVYRYCELFYNIYNTDLIDALIASGRKAIDSPERVKEYLDLALIFWKFRKAYFVQKKIEPSTPG